MLLRDLALGRRRELLDAGVLLFVPIYNVDGHERVSPWNRPNQDGPARGMGFRTTADGHDLNRDFLKLETPEARALVALVNAWRPHLHVDNHVTDGVDHDWELTWLVPEAPLIAAPVDAWLRRHFPPVLAATMRARPPPGAVRRPGRRPRPGARLRDPDHRAALLDRLLRAAQPALDPGRDPLAQALPRAGARQPRLPRRAARRGRARRP